MGGGFYENRLFNMVAMATWSFHTLIMGIIEKWYLLPSHCRYFYKTFTEILFLGSLLSALCVLTHCSYLQWKPKCQKLKKIYISSDTKCSMSLSLYRNIHPLSYYSVRVCVCVCVCVFMKISSSVGCYGNLEFP